LPSPVPHRTEVYLTCVTEANRDEKAPLGSAMLGLDTIRIELRLLLHA